MDENNVYQGPLARTCQCKVEVSLARKQGDEGFRTSRTDIYPPRLDLGIAEAIMKHVQISLDTSSKEGEGEAPKEDHKGKDLGDAEKEDEELKS